MRRLSRREQIVVVVGLCFFIAFAGLQWVLLPSMDRRARLENQVAARETALAEMLQRRSQYLRTREDPPGQMPAAGRREADFTLFSFLDQQAVKSGIKENIVHMKPDTRSDPQGRYTVSMVTIKIESLYLKGLVAFIHGIETAGKGVYITGISLSRTGKRALLDVLLEARTVTVEKEK